MSYFVPEVAEAVTVVKDGYWAAKHPGKVWRRTTKSKKARKHHRQKKAAKAAKRAVARPLPVARIAPTTTLTAPPIVAPVAYGARIRQSYKGLDNFEVKHNEYITDIFGSTDFQVRSYRVNPGSVTTFPWLSAIAPNYEKYKFTSLKFFIRPQAPANTPGVCMLALDYDPTDDPPQSKAAMFQKFKAERANAWTPFSITSKKMSDKFIAPVKPTTGADLRQSDAATLYVGTAANATTTAISELWAEYTVALKIPQARLSCDTLRFQKNDWNYNVPLDANSFGQFEPSVNWSFGSASASIVCERAGTYVCLLSCWNIPVIDLSGGGGGYSIGFHLNGVDITENVQAGPLASLPDQTRGMTSTTMNGVQINVGDVITLHASDEAVTPNISCAIYPAT